MVVFVFKEGPSGYVVAIKYHIASSEMLRDCKGTVKLWLMVSSSFVPKVWIHRGNRKVGQPCNPFTNNCGVRRE